MSFTLSVFCCASIDATSPSNLNILVTTQNGPTFSTNGAKLDNLLFGGDLVEVPSSDMVTYISPNITFVSYDCANEYFLDALVAPLSGFFETIVIDASKSFPDGLPYTTTFAFPPSGALGPNSVSITANCFSLENSSSKLLRASMNNIRQCRTCLNYVRDEIMDACVRAVSGIYVVSDCSMSYECKT